MFWIFALAMAGFGFGLGLKYRVPAVLAASGAVVIISPIVGVLAGASLLVILAATSGAVAILQTAYLCGVAIRLRGV